MKRTINFLVLRDERGGEAWLTNQTPSARYGAPVLMIESDDVDGDLGPSDLIYINPERMITAAAVVAGWATKPERTAEEIGAARVFLRQWPEGPQIVESVT